VIAAGLAVLGAGVGGGVAYRRRQAARKRPRFRLRRK
jgi:hypothetical protein